LGRGVELAARDVVSVSRRVLERLGLVSSRNIDVSVLSLERLGRHLSISLF